MFKSIFLECTGFYIYYVLCLLIASRLFVCVVAARARTVVEAAESRAILRGVHGARGADGTRHRHARRQHTAGAQAQ